ncbi:MAG: S41 family peptidase [Planctomycetota bacterium]|jgi:carboxyl-terminal processing protease|nr:S41 family peptidase [Planctomycetota bacterium]MDP7130376.1 S41 family peptidase [Planctomycetota bacterium]
MGRREIVWVAIILLLLGISMGPAKGRRSGVYPEYELLARMMERIRKSYVSDVDQKKLFLGAMDGVAEELDPYSQYLPPREAKELKVDTEGQYGGLGIQISLRKPRGRSKDQLVVVTPIEDTPAYRAGVLAGDFIIAIDGKSTDGFTIPRAVDLLRGKPGSEVTLTLANDVDRKTRKVTLKRARIRIQSVKGYKRLPEGGWNYWADHENKIGYIRITQFQEKTVLSMDKVVKTLVADGLKGLILDLRNNPGGLLNIAIDMADRFTDRGIIVLTKGRSKDAYHEYKAKPGDDYSKFPLVVLVNGSSASASEIVAGCLQDRKLAAVVGDRSYGKGSVQSIFSLVDNTHKLKLTTAHYYTPTGRNIHRLEGAKATDDWGVIPDVTVKLSRDDMIALRRNSLDMEIIKRREEKKEGPEKPESDKPETEKEPKSDKPEEEEKPKTEEPKTAPEEKQPEKKDPQTDKEDKGKKSKSAGKKVVDKQFLKAIEILKDDAAYKEAVEADQYKRDDEAETSAQASPKE